MAPAILFGTTVPITLFNLGIKASLLVSENQEVKTFDKRLISLEHQLDYEKEN